MEKTPFQVNLSGIIKILSDHLYSQKDVFIRELLQNAIDAINARKKAETFEPLITIEYFNNSNGAGFVISDNGIGLTAEQVEEFLAKIGSSSKLDDSMRNDFIGQFGIGILSCFMVSDDIILITRPSEEDQAIKWTGNIDGTYAIETIDYDLAMGTKVILKLRDKIKLNSTGIVSSIKKYGQYLHIPIDIEVNGISKGTINRSFPWEENLDGDQCLAIGQEVFDEGFTNYILLKDKKTNRNQGVLYLSPQASYLTDRKEGYLYVKRIFVTTASNDILPKWAVFVRAIINSENISLNASRESIYPNEVSEQLKKNIEGSIKEYFYQLSKSAPSTLKRIIITHSFPLKQMALTDESFLVFIAKWFEFYTTYGQLNLNEIRELNETIFYVTNVDEFKQIIPIAIANKKLVVNAGYTFDKGIIKKISIIDKTSDYVEIAANYFGDFLGNIDVDDHQKYEPIINDLQLYLDKYHCKIKLRGFDPESIPSIYHASIDSLIAEDIKNIQKDQNDLWKSISESVFDPQEQYNSRLYLNLKNKVVSSLLKKSGSLNDLIIKTLYVNAKLLGHYSLNNIELLAMNDSFSDLIQLALISKKQ